MSLLQIYQWVCQWKNFENRLIFGEVMGKSLVSCFFLRHSVHYVTVLYMYHHHQPGSLVPSAAVPHKLEQVSCSAKNSKSKWFTTSTICWPFCLWCSIVCLTNHWGLGLLSSLSLVLPASLRPLFCTMPYNHSVTLVYFLQTVGASTDLRFLRQTGRRWHKS